MDWAANLDTAAVGALVSARVRGAGAADHRAGARARGRSPRRPTEPGRGRRARRRGSKARSQAEEPPKETYDAIADLPGPGLEVRARRGPSPGAWSGWPWAGSGRLLVWLPLVPVGLALGLIDWRTRLLPTWLIAPHVRRGGSCSPCWPLPSPRTGRTSSAPASGSPAPGCSTTCSGSSTRVGSGSATCGSPASSASRSATSARPSWSSACTPGSSSAASAARCSRCCGSCDRKHVPFGPFMLVGAVLGLLFGDWVGSLTNG